MSLRLRHRSRSLLLIYVPSSSLNPHLRKPRSLASPHLPSSQPPRIDPSSPPCANKTSSSLHLHPPRSLVLLQAPDHLPHPHQRPRSALACRLRRPRTTRTRTRMILSSSSSPHHPNEPTAVPLLGAPPLLVSKPPWRRRLPQPDLALPPRLPPPTDSAPQPPFHRTRNLLLLRPKNPWESDAPPRLPTSLVLRRPHLPMPLGRPFRSRTSRGWSTMRWRRSSRRWRVPRGRRWSLSARNRRTTSPKNNGRGRARRRRRKRRRAPRRGRRR